MSNVLLVGDNPCVTLTRDGAPTVFASIWVVDWSVRGAGHVLVVWHDGDVRVLTDNPPLGEWLTDSFVRHYPEVDGLPWPAATVEWADLDVEIDLAGSVLCRSEDVEITMSGALDRRMFTTDEAWLDGVRHGLTLLRVPMREATVSIAGEAVAGAVTHAGSADEPTSSAFVTTAEVWTGPIE